MDIGEQQRVIIVEPEPVEFPEWAPDPSEIERPAVLPTQDPEPANP